LGWAPPIIGVIEADPAVLLAQEQRVPASLRSEKLARRPTPGDWLALPWHGTHLAETQTESRSLLRLPKTEIWIGNGGRHGPEYVEYTTS